MSENFTEKFKRINWNSSAKRMMFWTKVVLIICLLISGFSNSVIGWAVQQVEVPCIEDVGFELLASLNLNLSSNHLKLSALVTSTSLICDFLFICFAVRQLFWSQSFKTTIGLAVVYFVHLFVRQFFWLRVPEGRCWEDPWLPSLIFAYHESPDFFFSTSAAAVFLFAAENREVKNWVLFTLAGLAMVLVWVTTIATRLDYSVSLLTGVMMGHYSWIVAEHLQSQLNRSQESKLSDCGLDYEQATRVKTEQLWIRLTSYSLTFDYSISLIMIKTWIPLIYMKSALKEAFLAGLSGDTLKMRNSTEYLNSLKSSPGLIQTCIEISLTDDSSEVQQLSAIFLKNLTKIWKDSKRDYQLPPDDKDFLKSNILSLLLFSVPDKIRAQFSEIAFNICKYDFPWDLILSQIDLFLSSLNPDQIFASLTMISQIAKVYEHKINDRRDNLKILVVRYFKKMRVLLRTLLAESDENRFRYVSLILQIYWTCFYADLPEEQATVENLQDWLSMCREVLLFDMTGLDAIPENNSTFLEDHPKWVCKKWSSQILHRFFNKYFNTLYLRDHHKFIGEYFQSTWAVPLSQEILSLLLQSRSCFVPNTVTNYLLKFLIQAVRLQVTYDSLRPSCELIISYLIIPNLKRTPEDEELYKTDAVEFIRRETDLGKAYFCSKASAAELLKSVCERSHLEYFMNYLKDHLRTDNLLIKESLFYALGVLNKVIKTSKTFINQIEPILNNFAIQEFSSAVGLLRSRVCWLYSCFADLAFSDLEKQEQALGHICRLMVDSDLPVRIEAATALPKFFSWPKAKLKISSEIKQVLQIYIELISLIDYEELIEALEDVVSHFSNEVRPFALDLSKCLVSAFISMSAREADDSVVAAESLLNTLGKLIDVLDDDCESLLKISFEVMPMVDLVLSSQDLNFFDPTLSILSSLLYYCPAGSLPHLCKYAFGLYSYVVENGKVKDFVKDNLEDVFSPFGNFLQKYKNFSSENLDLFVSFATIMINDGYIQLSIGCKVFTSIIENSAGDPVVLTQVLINSYPVFTSNEAKKIKALFVQIVLTALWKNAEFTLDYMKKILCFDSVFKFVIENHMIFKEELQVLQAVLGLLSTLAVVWKYPDFAYFQPVFKVFVGLWKRLQNIRCPGSFEDLENLDFDRDDDFEGENREMYESVLETVNVELVVKGVLSNIAGVLNSAGLDEDDKKDLRVILN